MYININQLISCVQRPAVDSRIKTLDAGIPLLQTESEFKAAEHSSSAEYCYVRLSTC